MEQSSISSFLATEEESHGRFLEQLHDVLSGLRLGAPPMCKSWSVREPGVTKYAFRVVWLPGTLHLSGDLDPLTVVHHAAMPTWPQAAIWVAGASFDYLMGKSTIQKEFNQIKTVTHLVQCANEDLASDGSVDQWERIFAYLDGFVTDGKIFQAQFQDPHRFRDREQATRLLLREAYADFTPETLYSCFDAIDWSGVYDYHPYALWQYEALQLWARLTMKTEEFRQLGETQHG